MEKKRSFELEDDLEVRLTRRNEGREEKRRKK